MAGEKPTRDADRTPEFRERSRPDSTPSHSDDRSSTSQKQNQAERQGPRDRQIDPPAGSASNVEREREQD